MTLFATIAVPAAPMLLPDASPAQPSDVAAATGALRDAVANALSVVTDADTVVLLASGDQPLLHDAGLATLDSYGVVGADRILRTDRVLLAAVADRGQAPMVRSGRLDGDLAVLALQVLRASPEAAVLPVTVPASAEPDALSAMAAGVVGAIAGADRSIVVLAAGDLSACLDVSSPGYLVDGAGQWDEAAVRAVAATDPTALAALGPAAADRFQARGWAPLTVLLAIAAGSDHAITTTDYHAPRGVGQLVAQ